MQLDVLNREYRDEASVLKHPFSEKAEMVSEGGLSVPTAAFLDLLVYAPDKAPQPFYLAELRKSPDHVIGLVKDASGSPVAEFELDPAKNSATLFMSGLDSGAVVYDSSALLPLLDACVRSPVTFGVNMPIASGRCFTYTRPYLAGVGAVGGLFSGEVFLVAAYGMRWVEDPNDAGAYMLCMLGEESKDNKAITSINGISREHFWFSAAPESDVKIETKSSELLFRSVADE